MEKRLGFSPANAEFLDRNGRGITQRRQIFSSPDVAWMNQFGALADEVRSDIPRDVAFMEQNGIRPDLTDRVRATVADAKTTKIWKHRRMVATLLAVTGAISFFAARSLQSPDQPTPAPRPSISQTVDQKPTGAAEASPVVPGAAEAPPSIQK